MQDLTQIRRVPFVSVGTIVVDEGNPGLSEFFLYGGSEVFAAMLEAARDAREPPLFPAPSVAPDLEVYEWSSTIYGETFGRTKYGWLPYGGVPRVLDVRMASTEDDLVTNPPVKEPFETWKNNYRSKGVKRRVDKTVPIRAKSVPPSPEERGSAMLLPYSKAEEILDDYLDAFPDLVEFRKLGVEVKLVGK